MRVTTIEMKNNKEIFPIYKPVGISPLDAIKSLKSNNPELRKKMAYAGRLDPMAEGVVLIITGEELKNFHDHLKHDKEYIGEILFGFSSDTYDVLGLVERSDKKINREEVRKKLEDSQGDFKFKLPPFSGYKLDGKPLFKWALEGRLDEVDIPTKTAQLKNISVSEIYEISLSGLKAKITDKLSRVIGDFRQEEIKSRWKRVLNECSKESFIIAKIKINCSSGFYVRSLADMAGKSLGTGGLLFSLKRTKVGEWGLEESIEV